MQQVKFFVVVIVALMASHLIFAQLHSVINKSDSSKIILSKLTGTWQLIEYADLNAATGTWTYDYGLHPKGFFTYTTTGIVNLNISVDTAFRITEDSAKNYNVNLLKWLYNYSVGYFGTYSVDVDKSVVTHHVKGGSIPWYIDTDQPRPFSFHGDTLIIGDNKTWKRVLIKAD